MKQKYYTPISYSPSPPPISLSPSISISPSASVSPSASCSASPSLPPDELEVNTIKRTKKSNPLKGLLEDLL